MSRPKRKSGTRAEAATLPSILGAEHSSTTLPPVPSKGDEERDLDATASARSLDLSNEEQTATPSETAMPAGSSAFAHRDGSHRDGAHRVAEKYRILGEHGRGGLGRVSRAHDHELDRDVAIKELLHRTHIGEVRFFREALITARLEHPGIVPVHEAGRWPDGTPFYAMKLVAGRPLRDLISERNTVPQRIELLHHVIAVADAIAYAHGRNIIHRDLKPANVIVGDFGETIVIDWGLAKDLSTTDELSASGGPSPSSSNNDLTNTGSILGTPTYMAPEQARGERVDQRADVFAIGAMLWELCSLQKVPPSSRRERERLLHRANIDRDLITILYKALEDDPASRYADASDLAADLKAFKAGSRIAARDYSLFQTLSHWIRHHRAWALTALLVLLASTGGAALYLHNVTAQRNRAELAEQQLKQQHDDLVLKHAELQLTKDPSAAIDILATYTGDGMDRANQLRAAAYGQGVATLRATPHNNYVIWAAGTPHDGVVALGMDGTITRTRSAQDIAVLARDASPLPTFGYDKVTRTLAYPCGPSSVCLLDIMNSRKTASELGADTINGLAFSTTGRRLGVLHQSGSLQVFEVTDRTLHLIKQRSLRDNEALLFVTETSIAVGGHDRITLVDLEHDEQDKSLVLPDTTFWDKDPDSARLAVTNQTGEIYLIDANRLVVDRRQQVCQGRLTGVRFVHSRNLAAYTCMDGLLASWDLSTWQTKAYAHLPGAASALTVDDSGALLIAAAGDHSVNIADLETGIITTYRGGEYRLTMIQSPVVDFPYIITGDIHGGVRVWPRPSRYASVEHNFVTRFWEVGATANKVFATTSNSQIVSFSKLDGARAQDFWLPNDMVLGVSPQGDMIATAGGADVITLWSTTTTSRVESLRTHGGTVAHLAFFRDGSLLASDLGGRLIYWSRPSAPVVLDQREAEISSFAFAEGARVVIEATTDGSLWTRTMGTSAAARRLTHGGAVVTAMKGLADGLTVMVGRANGELLAIDARTGDSHTLITQGDAIHEIVISPDGKHIAVSTNGERVYWGDTEGIAPKSLSMQWHTLVVAAGRIAFGDDDSLILACADGRVWIYSTIHETWLLVVLGAVNLTFIAPMVGGFGVYLLDTESDVIWLDLRRVTEALELKPKF